MVKHFFPAAKLLWTRFPAEISSFKAGKTLAAAAAALGRRVKVLGSTDLTHDGPTYGFSPQGTGRAALEGVKTVNDRRFIEAVIEGNPAEVLARAENEYSACSAGAVLGVLGFAAGSGTGRDGGTSQAGGYTAELLEYRTSADAESGEPPASFVGYGAFGF
jgi:AmmeMemoRadiSam system protein B